MKLLQHLTLLVLTSVALMQPALAGHDGCRLCCPGCGEKVCRTYSKMEKVSKSCFELECEEVCIPRVRMPWHRCCEVLPGKVRTVVRLKEREYECEKCGYEWHIECANGCGRCYGICGSTGCATTPCATTCAPTGDIASPPPVEPTLGAIKEDAPVEPDEKPATGDHAAQREPVAEAKSVTIVVPPAPHGIRSPSRSDAGGAQSKTLFDLNEVFDEITVRGV